MSNRPFLLLMLGALMMSGAVLNSHAASRTAPSTPPLVEAPSLSCLEIVCHSQAECDTGTTPCGVCVIPKGASSGSCVRR